MVPLDPARHTACGACLSGAARSGRPRSSCHRRGACGRSRVGDDDAPLGVARLWHEPDRPTAERLLEAFQDITLTITKGPQQTDRHVTALRPLQQRILEILGFSSALYTRLCAVSAEPP